TSLTGEKSIISQQSSDLHSQIGLNGALENFFYFQIPLQYREQSGTAELYVFERSKKNMEGRNDCTILIALDTQNMGRIETMLRSDGNGLDLNLRLKSDTACRYAEEHASELKQSLNSSGFTVKNLSFGLLQTKTTPVNAQNVFANLSSFTPGGLNIQV
ncbi:MAG: flagellar hook-length control protein FliK, partial [Eubacteriales bacterium]